MKLIEQLQLLDRLDQLIRLKATGTPDELADRLGVSRRTVYNLIQMLNDLGAEISYNKCRGSFQYDADIQFQFDLVITEPENKKVKGGQSSQIFGYWDSQPLWKKKISIFSKL